jgi:HSP20 family protein
MVHFRFPIHQLPSALQEFATDVETIVDHVLKSKGDCSGEACESNGACEGYTPSIDIVEADTQYNLYVDLPGVKAADVSIEVLDEKLTISGTRHVVEHGETANVHRRERVSGKFSRSVRLPKQLDTEKIEAQFDNGVLHIALPKQPKPVARTIEIKTVQA